MLAGRVIDQFIVFRKDQEGDSQLHSRGKLLIPSLQSVYCELTPSIHIEYVIRTLEIENKTLTDTLKNSAPDLVKSRNLPTFASRGQLKPWRELFLSRPSLRYPLACNKHGTVRIRDVRGGQLRVTEWIGRELAEHSRLAVSICSIG